MSAHEPPSTDTGPHLTLRDLVPLVGFVVPTLATAYGWVMPRYGITGVNELTVGFASTVLGACIAYVVGLRAAIRRRPRVAASSPARRWHRPEWIARQSAWPNGVIGWILGHIMGTETAAANDTTVRFADITPDAHVLDIGCGAGHALQRVGHQLTTGRVVGLDASPTMVRLATRRNRRLIAQGRATIAKGDVGQLPYPPASFDRILATHTVYFWRDLAHAARELRRVLKPDGLLALGFGDPESMRATFPPSVYTLRTAAEIARILTTTGFADTSIETSKIGGQITFWLLARQQSSLMAATAMNAAPIVVTEPSVPSQWFAT
jgi:SAM-dependent methyltransferase